MADKIDKIDIFDTTLRDGEQSPGFSMSVEDKLALARQLKKLNVDIIEAGFPISSPEQFTGVNRIAEEIEGPTIAGLSRALEEDIIRCSKALKPAKKSRIHTFIATSPIHMEFKLKKSHNEVLNMVKNAVALARSLSEEVEFSAEDATRSELSFLAEVFSAAIESGASVINVPDTVGYTVPSEYKRIIDYLFENVHKIDSARVSVHCQNDLGLATANSLAGIESGARQVECTINGIGERAGNASLEEVVAAINVRKNHYKIENQIRSQEIYPSSLLLSKITGISVQPNKAIVGKNAFAHEAGIHQDGVLKHPQTYEIMTPESIGRPNSSIVLGRHSGKHGFQDRLRQLGIEIKQENDFQKAYQRFLLLADKKKEVFDEDLYSIVADEIRHQKELYSIVDFHTFCGSDPTISSATVILEQLEQEDEKETKQFHEASTGDGPVNALFSAIDKITQIRPVLERYNLSAVTRGANALGEASVLLHYEGDSFSGHGASTDVIYASAKAYITAVNKIIRAKALKVSETVSS